MEKEKVNNYKCDIKLAEFKNLHFKPIEERWSKGNAIMNDPKTKWESGYKKEQAKRTLEALQKQRDDYFLFMQDVQQLINQHESLVTTLSELYGTWYNRISKEGTQPQEMMRSKALALEGIFVELYKVLEPLKLEIKAPESFK